MLNDLCLRIRTALIRAQRDEAGQGMAEYALILVLIAVVVILILTIVGKQVNNAFSNVSSGLGT
jgi:pilus assembly protein Flp/PilA